MVTHYSIHIALGAIRAEGKIPTNGTPPSFNCCYTKIAFFNITRNRKYIIWADESRGILAKYLKSFRLFVNTLVRRSRHRMQYNVPTKGLRVAVRRTLKHCMWNASLRAAVLGCETKKNRWHSAPAGQKQKFSKERRLFKHKSGIFLEKLF